MGRNCEIINFRLEQTEKFNDWVFCQQIHQFPNVNRIVATPESQAPAVRHVGGLKKRAGFQKRAIKKAVGNFGPLNKTTKLGWLCQLSEPMLKLVENPARQGPAGFWGFKDGRMIAFSNPENLKILIIMILTKLG